MENGRRDFVRLLVFAGVGTALGACGEDSGEPAVPNCNLHGGKATAISANHGHVLEVPAADFAAGDHTYSIAGTSGHDHQIALTAAQLAQIMAGTQVQVTSTESAVPGVHTHLVTVGCSSGAAGGGGGGYEPYP
jgi:hypothetical protein